jgi:monofunctional glycosyltransferase
MDRRSVLPVSDKACRCNQHVGLLAIGGQQRDSLCHKHIQPLLGPVDAVTANQCCLAASGILAGRLAHGLRIGRHIQHVIGQLEGKADHLAETTKALAVLGAGAGNDGPGLAGKAQKRAGFHRLQHHDAVFAGRVGFGLQIQRLPAGHAANAGSTRQRQHQLHLAVVGKIGLGRCNEVEGIGQQAVAGEDGCRLVKGLVDGRLAAAQVVIVHGRQVVMDQRIAVQTLKGCANAGGHNAVSGKQGGCFRHQKGPQPLAAVQRAVAHGCNEHLRTGDFVHPDASAQKVGQQALRLGGAVAQIGVEGGGIEDRHGGFIGMTAGGWQRSFGENAVIVAPATGLCPHQPLCTAFSDENEWQNLDTTPERQPEEEDPLPKPGRKIALPQRAKMGLVALGALLVVPYALVILYALPFIHPVSTLMVADLVTFQGYDRRWVPLDKIAPVLARSVMMSEDGQFCAHDGVDWVQMRGVVQDALDGEPTRGASTIPMQTAKNLFLWNGRNVIRKVLEVPLAMWADLVWSKRRMMEIYLNVAEWGPGIYGIEAAARHHFGVSAASLSQKQAGLLAVALPNPFTRVASKPGRGMQRLASVVERRARASGGYIKCLYD